MPNKLVSKFFRLSPKIERSRRKSLKRLIVVMILAIFWCLIYSILFLFMGSWMAYLVLIYAVIGVLLVIMLKRYGNDMLFISIYNVQLISILLISIYNFGWDYGFQYILIGSFLFTSLRRYRYLIFPVLINLATFCAIFSGYYIFQHLNEHKPQYSVEIRDMIHFINITFACLAVGLMSKRFEKDVHLSEITLKAEKQKSENLLHSILPISIANRLKDEQQIIADGFEQVSVLFADIVGFTKISEKLTPDEVVAVLNIVFTEFDLLVEKYKLEKIKTIGDAYMVSGGLIEKDSNHLEKIANMALEMIEKIGVRKELIPHKMSIRIGIHAGPAVAGVIGVKKFAYDLWGDTVNTASRMESYGVSGKINVTENVKNLLDYKFEFKKRQPMEIKGKGKMQTYFLIGLKNETTANSNELNGVGR